MHATVPLRNLAVIAGLSQKLEEAHVVASPGTRHVLLHDLRHLFLPRNGHDELPDGRRANELWMLLHGELQDHLRLQRMVVR